MKKLIGTILLGVLALNPVQGQSHEDPVLDLMVRKGLVTQAEADGARAEEARESEGKKPANIQLATPGIKKLVFYGDGRLRYENINEHNHYTAFTLTDRERYRLRFGADYFYSDNLKAGFELESGNTNDSANQTMGAMFSKSSINVGKVYIQYQPVDWLTAVAGKFANPWYTTTDMVYSFDENPEGGAELFSYTIPLDTKDSSLTVGLNAVQYLYVNSNEATLGLNNNDVFIIGEQIPVTWKISKDFQVKVAPGFTFYTGGGNTNFDSGVATSTSNTSAGTTPSTTNGVPASTYFATANSAIDPVFISSREADHLAIFSAPGEFNFNVAGIPFRPYWDFEYNTQGKARIQNVYLQPTGTAAAGGIGTGVTAAAASQNEKLNDAVAWALGLQIGVNKKKGDWSGLVEFRQIGLGAVDQNINGTDYANSYANQEGFKLSTVYNFTDFLTGTVTFYDTWDYKKNLYQSLGGTSASPTATTSSTLNLVGEKSNQRVQVDLGWKF